MIRLQLEPYLIHFISSDTRIMRELIQRNENRWGFCKEDVPPPTSETRKKVFREGRRLTAVMPRARDNVFPKARNKRTRGHSSQDKRGNIFWWRIRTSLTAIFWPIGPLFSLRPTSKTRKYERPSDKITSGGNNFTSPINDSSSCGILKGRASVIDGDTIKIHGQRIRIWGIDAPEDGQLCVKDGKPWRCGRDSAEALAAFLGARTVTCIVSGLDDFSRMLATCEVGGQDAGSWLVRNGWALDYKHFSKGRYAVEEVAAKKAGYGLWQGEFEPPWIWRERARRLSKTTRHHFRKPPTKLR